ncbi:MAG: hypothetical protein KGR26_03755 [Cyanobacteria bacterium REEB65]|nr:hypothetical protein [Cyanobacteria bacterium REEB65]
MGAFGRELASWISSCIAAIPGQQVAVLFGRTGRIPRRFKAQGRRVVVHDVCMCHHLFERALLLDAHAGIPPEAAAAWLQLHPQGGDPFGSWAGTAFTAEETRWLGSWRQHILESPIDPRQAACGTIAVFNTMAYWLTWNRNELGHKPLPPPSVFRHYVDQVNLQIQVSGQAHEARVGIPGSLPMPPGCDIFYCYLPPAEGMRAMDRRLAFWERWVLGDPAALLDFDRPGQLGGPFASEEDRAAELGRLLEKMVDIPTWCLAFSGQGDAIAAAVERWRPITALHEFAVPPWRGSRSVIIHEGLIVAGKAA